MTYGTKIALLSPIYRHKISIVFIGLIVISVLILFPNIKPALAFNVPVIVSIDRVVNLDQSEATDFFANVMIAGGDSILSDVIDDEDDISPGWIFTKEVDSNIGSIPISIEIWDDDGFLTFANDHEDILKEDGRTLNLNLNLAPCTITGAVSGICGSTLSSLGLEEDRAYIEFRANVVETGASGLGVECLHSPIWPQTTDTININAKVLDGELKQDTKLADSIEIWMSGDLNNPAKQGSGSDLTHTIGPFSNGGTFTYGCVVKKGGDSVFSGWKTVQVGLPPEGRAIPALYTAPRSNSIDIVFIPDSDDYNAPNDPTFLTDVETVIKTYYSERIFYDNQHLMNFWIAQDMGNANGFNPATLMCNNVPPANWNTDYTFADAGAIVHATVFQDCAQPGPRLFSGDLLSPSGPRVFLHETGHQPFGEADEHLPPGGYWQNDIGPNIFRSQADCDAQKLVSETCRTWTSSPIDRPPNTPWFTSDPTPNDLMDDNQVAQRLDKLRIGYIFGECNFGRC